VTPFERLSFNGQNFCVFISRLPLRMNRACPVLPHSTQTATGMQQPSFELFLRLSNGPICADCISAVDVG